MDISDFTGSESESSAIDSVDDMDTDTSIVTDIIDRGKISIIVFSQNGSVRSIMAPECDIWGIGGGFSLGFCP